MRQSLPSDRRRAERVALVSLGAALFLVAAKLAAGLASGSLALLSEAAHSALDAGATLITYVAVRIASRPPDPEHPYGHGKAENISALLETVGLLVLSIFIAREAVERLAGGAAEVQATWYAFAVIGLSIVVDLSRSRALRKAGEKYRSAALKADALHFTADLMTSTVVLGGLILVRAGYHEADAYGGLFVALYVAFQSLRLGKLSVDVLMDRAPTGALQRLEGAAASVEGVEEVRRVRTRYSGGQQQADIVVAISRSVPLEKAHEVTEEVERVVGEIEPGADVLVHVEPLADEKLIRQKVLAVTAREGRAQQVHNVSVTFHPEGVHVSLHAKFPGNMSLAEAHSIAESLEAEIAREIDAVSRVDTHLEPLEPPGAPASDVTEARADLASWVQKFAESQPEVRNCHEVLISEVGGGHLAIVMHCEASPGLSVSSVHDVSNRIENEVHRRWPVVARVTVHFEPAEVS